MRLLRYTLAAALLALSANLLQAQTCGGFGNSFTEPFSSFAFVSCANGGLGEPVFISGERHVVFASSSDCGGGFHSVSHSNVSNVTAVGAITGTTYRFVNAGTFTQNYTAGATENTQTGSFRLIGQGPDNNLLLHMVNHFTVTPSGEFTSHTEFTAECR